MLILAFTLKEKVSELFTKQICP